MNPTEFSDLINQSLARSAYNSAPTNEQAKRSGGMVSMGNAPSLEGLPPRAGATERKATPVLVTTPIIALGNAQNLGTSETFNGRHGIDTSPRVTASNDAKAAAETGVTAGSAAVDHDTEDAVAKENQRIWELIQTIYQ